jgi:hypothetical protein
MFVLLGTAVFPGGNISNDSVEKQLLEVVGSGLCMYEYTRQPITEYVVSNMAVLCVRGEIDLQ